VDDLFSSPLPLGDSQTPSQQAAAQALVGLGSGDKSELVFDSEGNMVLQTVSSSTHTISGEATTTVESATAGYDFAYRRPKPTKWSDDETQRFYEALEMYGHDQMLINTALPNFTPAQIRQKFKAEMRKFPARFNATLYTSRKTLDASIYEEQHGKIANPVQPVLTVVTAVETPDVEDQQQPQTPIPTQENVPATLDSLFHI
jgi:hypothetical protein